MNTEMIGKGAQIDEGIQNGWEIEPKLMTNESKMDWKWMRDAEGFALICHE